MKLHQIPKVIWKRIHRNVCCLLKRDPITYAKVAGRKDLKEIGTEYGGWVVPASLFNEDSICYCVGCGEDISFDTGLIDQFGCDVYGFDPTPRAIEHVRRVAGNNPKYHFLEIGLWDKEDTLKFFVPENPDHVSHSLLNLQKTEDYISAKVKRLFPLMEELGHHKLDLLKIDIEGAEYRVLESIIEDTIDIQVICVEYDECYNPLDKNYTARIRASINSLISNGYSLVYAQRKGNYTFLKNA